MFKPVLEVEIYEKLIEKMKTYRPTSDLALVENAYKLAKAAHEGQTRKSGEAYIIHPLEVALILADLELDRETIAAGILHDIIEDTEYTYENLEEMFGTEVAKLVDGVTKLEKFHLQQKHSENTKKTFGKSRAHRGISREEEQAENYRKLFIAMANDLRVILIKFADRVHNLRTLVALPPEKQKRIAQESLDIYAPLAGRLGISALRREMEDLAFKHSDPEAYTNLKEKMNMKFDERIRHIDDIVLTIKMSLESHGISADVKGRAKHFFSIHKKMKNQEKDMTDILDLFAVRIIVDTVAQCWQALGVVHEDFIPMQEKQKNYISQPKSNGYQSIHDVLLGPDGEPFEVQVRTKEMHRTAENGIAAHWKYKEGKAGQDDGDEKIAWLSQILELQQDNPNNDEFLPLLKGDLNVYTEWVHCYTPQGEVKVLPKGATCIDFAYAIHSAVGNRMVGSKVNGKIVPKNYELKDSDRIEILTNKNSKGPTKEWLKLAKTGQAKNKINQWLKKENREESIIKGRELLEKAAKNKGLSLSKLHTPQGERLVLMRHSMHDFDTLCAAIGRGTISEKSITNRLYEEYIAQNPEIAADAKAIIEEINKNVRLESDKTFSGDIIVQGEGDVATRYSKCCNPVPGDKIVGFVTRGRGVAVHRENCVNIRNLAEKDAPRLIEVNWNSQTGNSNHFSVQINIFCDSMACISQVTAVFDKMSIEIKSFIANDGGGEAIFTATVAVSDRDVLEKISARLLSLKGVHEVERLMT